MGNGWQWYGRPKALLLPDNSLDLVCQCIKVMMHVRSLFVCDALFRCTLEKLFVLAVTNKVLAYTICVISLNVGMSEFMLESLYKVTLYYICRLYRLTQDG